MDNVKIKNDEEKDLNRLNELILKMITYYNGDPKRIQHFIKVHSFAKLIGEQEKLDSNTQQILEVAAVVHDIGIKKAEELYGLSHGKLQEELGPAIAEELLIELGYEESLIRRVSYLIGHHHTYNQIDGYDYQILVEADFLVNLYEDDVKENAIQTAYEKLFRTDSGKQILQTMFHI